jgi:hypothetical protein
VSDAQIRQCDIRDLRWCYWASFTRTLENTFTVPALLLLGLFFVRHAFCAGAADVEERHVG